ncbi:MAG: ExbD/TolR family protein [Planctomycetota bacterium]|jgi:biopolymer transport protein ExbD
MDAKNPEMKMNLTPMIDVVFQLIIFFMLVTEMAQADLEILSLPEASQAMPDPGNAKRVVVNITAPEGEGACRIKVRGQEMNLRGLRTYLRTEAQLQPDLSRPGVSELPVLIRADRETPFRYTQAVLQECVRPGIRIWKVQIAASEPKVN